MYINKLYKPEELIDVTKNLKAIIDIWNGRAITSNDKPLEHWIILALHKRGYRIIKTG